MITALFIFLGVLVVLLFFAWILQASCTTVHREVTSADWAVAMRQLTKIEKNSLSQSSKI